MVFERLEVESTPGFEKGGAVVDPGPDWRSWTLEDSHLAPYILHKLTSGMHFPRENEGSLKINADSTTLLLPHFHLTRKKPRFFNGFFNVNYQNHEKTIVFQ